MSDALATAQLCWQTISTERRYYPHWQLRGLEENRMALRLFALAKGNGWKAVKLVVWP